MWLAFISTAGNNLALLISILWWSKTFWWNRFPFTIITVWECFSKSNKTTFASENSCLSITKYDYFTIVRIIKRWTILLFLCNKCIAILKLCMLYVLHNGNQIVECSKESKWLNYVTLLIVAMVIMLLYT